MSEVLGRTNVSKALTFFTRVLTGQREDLARVQAEI